jgi:hypothetical protein
VARTGRTTVALTAALCLGLTLTATPSLAAAAAAPTVPGELVLPAAARAVPRATQILNAGSTGFLWAREGDDRLLWTEYATGTATALEQRLPAAVSYDIESGYFREAASFEVGWYGRGSDTVALYSGGESPHVTLLRGASASGGEVPLPQGHSYRGTFGDRVLTRTGDDGEPQAYHLWRVQGGVVTETAVTGLPAGADQVTVEDGDARSVVLRYKTGDESDGWGHWGIVDLATGEFSGLPDRVDPDDGWEVTGFRLGADNLLRLRSGRSALDVYDRDELLAEPRTVDTGQFTYQAAYGVVGSALLAVEPVWPGNNLYRGQPLWAVPFDSTDAEQSKVMDPAAHEVVPMPDGSALVAGAERYLPEGDLDWGIYRVTPAADGAVTRSRVTEVAPMPAQIHGLSLGSGILSRADNSTDYSPSTTLGAYRSTWLTVPAAGGTPAVTRTTVDGPVGGRDGFCSDSTVRCIAMFADGTGYHGRQDATESGLTMLYANGAGDWGPTLDTGEDTPNLIDLSGRYAVVNGVSYGRQNIGEFRGGGAGVVLQRRDPVAAAVWGSTLWSGAASGGEVKATRLPAGTAVESFTTTNGCTPTTLQAVGRWVYWACVDFGWVRGSGIYDRTAKRAVTAPAGDVLLGDGYLVVHDPAVSAGLKLVDLHGGLPTSGSHTDLPSRTLVSEADLGRYSGARTSWTVDRFGGGVAYADDQQRVHVVPTGVPASALSAIDSTVSTGAADWSGTWWLSKPAASWQLVFRSRSGATLRTVSGSEARGLLRAVWDGKDSAGNAVADGTFTWTLTAQPADGQGAALTVTNAAAVTVRR